MYKKNIVIIIASLHTLTVNDEDLNIKCRRKFFLKNKNQVIIELPKITRWRYKYLTKIRLQVKNKTIYYIDET